MPSLDVDDEVTWERLAAAMHGHVAAQQILAELVDIEPVKAGDEDPDADDYAADE